MQYRGRPLTARPGLLQEHRRRVTQAQLPSLQGSRERVLARGDDQPTISYVLDGEQRRKRFHRLKVGRRRCFHNEGTLEAGRVIESTGGTEMTIAMEDLRGALTCLAERFPQTFVLEGYQPHRPLKVGIAADLMSRCPELDRRKLSAALSAYTQRVMYLEGMVAGTARIDLDGNLAGEVSALDAEHAAERLAKILASRQATRAMAVAARSAERVARQPVPATATPPAAKTLKDKPVLRLPAFRVAALNRTGPARD